MTARGRALAILLGLAVFVAGWVVFVAQWSGPAGAGSGRRGFGVAGAKATGLGAFQGQLLIWAPGGFSDREVGLVRDSTRVAAISAVRTGLLPVASSRRRGYRVVPVEAMAVDPDAYAAAAGRPGAKLVGMLDKGAVLSKTGAALRHLQRGGRLRLDGGRWLQVSGVVDDELLAGYEVALDREVGRRYGVRRADYLLVLPRGRLTGLETTVRGLLKGRQVRFAVAGDQRFLRGDDGVLPLGLVKARFGEFALPSLGRGGPDPAWTRANLVTRKVPLLGRVRCHRLVIGDLAAAMNDLQRRKLGGLVDAADFHRRGGCWSQRLLRDSQGRLTRHAWGVAVVIHVAVNPAERRPTADQRLVKAMAGHGFTWDSHAGGPDAAYFEWVGAGA
ncbi:MAG TPA: hypothetical protein VFU54_17145 [Actinomycetota bacterium]|nr:hypothetical protein [Actinomycetota bacterium]